MTLDKKGCMYLLVIMPDDNRVVVYILERVDVAAYEGYKV